MARADRYEAAFRWMARIGYAARGLVFLIVGGFAAFAAAGQGTRTVGSRGALQAVLAQPFGQFLLCLVALGLLCFAGWRLLQAVFDADHYGWDFDAKLRRLGFAGSAVLHLALAAFALGIAFGYARRGDDDRMVRDWTAWLLAQPLGQVLTLLLGLAIVGFGLGLARKAIRADFRRVLQASAEERGWIVALGRAGFTARAVIFILVGGFLVVAALRFNAGEAAGLGGALRTLQHQPYGWVLLGVLALGLLAYGLFELAQAFYHRLDSPNVRKAAATLKAAPSR